MVIYVVKNFVILLEINVEFNSHGRNEGLINSNDKYCAK